MALRINLADTHFDYDARAADNLPGLAVLVYFAETSPLAEFLVVVHLEQLHVNQIE